MKLEYILTNIIYYCISSISVYFEFILPKQTKIATKVSNKKDTVTAKKSSAIKKSAVSKQTKTANEVSSKKDTAMTRKSSTGKKSAIPKETKKPGKK